MAFLTCFNLDCLFSKLTNKSCHPEKFLFWSVVDAVDWISCFPPSWFYAHVCSFQRKGSWEIICWERAYLKKVSFHPHFHFGYRANLDKNIFHSESSGSFSNVFKLPVCYWQTWGHSDSQSCVPQPHPHSWCSEISQPCVLVGSFLTHCWILKYIQSRD